MTDLTNIGAKVEVHRSEDGTTNPMDGSENCFLNGDTALRHERQLQSGEAQQIIGTTREKISAFNVHYFHKQAENQLQPLETVSVESDFIPNSDDNDNVLLVAIIIYTRLNNDCLMLMFDL